MEGYHFYPDAPDPEAFAYPVALRDKNATHNKGYFPGMYLRLCIPFLSPSRRSRGLPIEAAGPGQGLRGGVVRRHLQSATSDQEFLGGFGKVGAGMPPPL